MANERLIAAAKAVVRWNDTNGGLPADLWDLIEDLAMALQEVSDGKPA